MHKAQLSETNTKIETLDSETEAFVNGQRQSIWDETDVFHKVAKL